MKTILFLYFRTPENASLPTSPIHKVTIDTPLFLPKLPNNTTAGPDHISTRPDRTNTRPDQEVSGPDCSSTGLVCTIRGPDHTIGRPESEKKFIKSKKPETVHMKDLDRNDHSDVVDLFNKDLLEMETAFSSDDVDFDSSEGLSFADSSSILHSDNNDNNTNFEPFVTGSHFLRPIRHRLKQPKQVLSPIESASATLEGIVTEECGDDEKCEKKSSECRNVENESTNTPLLETNGGDHLNDSFHNSKGKGISVSPPPLPDEVGWSSDSASLSLSGMDTDGIIRASPEIVLYNSEKDSKTDFVADEPDSNIFDDSDKITCNTSQVNDLNKMSNNVHNSFSPPSSVTPKASGIPRLIRPRSYSLSDDSNSPGTAKRHTSNRISIDSDCNSIPQEFFVEREEFIYYTEDKLEKAMKTVDKRMETVQLSAEFTVRNFLLKIYLKLIICYI